MRVNSYYGWGWDSMLPFNAGDDHVARMSMINLSESWCKIRMVYFTYVEGSSHARSYPTWTVGSIQANLHRDFMRALATKKRAKWDSSIGTWEYEENGEKYRL